MAALRSNSHELTKGERTAIAPFRKVHINVIAGLLQVSPPAILKWDTCPRNKDGSYDLQAVIEWRVEQVARNERKSCQARVAKDTKKAIDPGKRKLQALQRENLRVAIAIKKKEFVNRAEVISEWSHLLSVFKSSLTRLGFVVRGKLGAKHLDVSILDIVHKTVDTEVDAALTRLVSKYAKEKED